MHKKLAYSLIYNQLIVTIVVTILWLVFSNPNAGFSAFCGSLAWGLPSFFFTKKVLRGLFPQKSSLEAFSVLKNFYLAELMKLAFSALLIILMTRFLYLRIAAFLTGFIAVLLISWLWSFYYLIRKKGNTP